MFIIFQTTLHDVPKEKILLVAKVHVFIRWLARIGHSFINRVLSSIYQNVRISPSVLLLHVFYRGTSMLSVHKCLKVVHVFNFL